METHVRLFLRRTRDAKSVRPRILLCLVFVRRILPTLDHQSVNVGHYLPHPNNERVQLRDTDRSGQSEPRRTSSDPWPFDTHSVQTIHQLWDLRQPLSHLVWGLPRNRVETITVFKCETEPTMIRWAYHRGAAGRRRREQEHAGSSALCCSYHFWHMLALLI